LPNNAKRWRLRMSALATLMALLAGGATLVAPSAAVADTATLSRQPFGSQSYFLRFTITNDTNVSENGWRIEFDLPQGEYATGLFQFEIRVTQTGQHFVVENARPTVLNPGSSVTSSVVIVGASWPLNCVTRGTPCTVG
jgi:chitinase